MFSEISKIIFIGGNRFNEDGPLLSFIDICKNRGICVKDLKADKGSKIRVGLRFVTPPEILFSALITTT